MGSSSSRPAISRTTSPRRRVHRWPLKPRLKNAFWMRNSHVEMIKRKSHWLGAHYWVGIHYCSESVTNIREWFDGEDPDVRFQFKDGKLVQVTVRSCDGKDLHLLK